MKKIAAFFIDNYIRMIIASLIGVALMLLYIVFQNESTTKNAFSDISYYRDGAAITAAVLFFIGLLVLVGHFGTFDIFSFYPGRKKKENGYKENYGDYVERKRIERGRLNTAFLAYIFIAFLFFMFSLIVYLILL